MKRLILLFFCFYIGVGLFSQTRIGYTYKSTSLNERINVQLLVKQAYDEMSIDISEFIEYVINILATDIDSDMRDKMNSAYSKLQSLQKRLNEGGHLGNIRSDFTTIKTSVQQDVVNYNNRIASRKSAQSASQNENSTTSSKPKSWTGTGFALKDGYIVTNWHIVEHAYNISIKGIGGNFSSSLRANVVASDKHADIAILKIDDNHFSGFGHIPYTISHTTADVAQDIYVLGYPLTSTMGEEIKYTSGEISSKTGFLGDVSLYQISAPIQPGNSGGPLIDSQGNIIGIVCAKHSGAENVGYAIKTSYLKNIVESALDNSIFPTGDRLCGLPRPEQIKQIKDFIYLIVCDSEHINIQPQSIRHTAPIDRQNHPPTIQEDSFGIKITNITNAKSKDINLYIESILIQDNQTVVNFKFDNYNSLGGYYEYVSISKEAHIIVDEVKHYITKAAGIKISPEKNYFSRPQETLRFTLFFPPIDLSSKSMDFIDPLNSSWEIHNINLK